MRRAMRGILVARALCGAATLAFAVWIGGVWGAAVAAVAILYLAATLYWFLRAAGTGRGTDETV